MASVSELSAWLSERLPQAASGAPAPDLPAALRALANLLDRQSPAQQAPLPLCQPPPPQLRLTELPAELLLDILALLDVRMRLRMSQTSRRMRALVFHPSLWQSASFGAHAPHVPDAFLASLAGVATRLRRLDLRRAAVVTDAGLVPLLRSARVLAELDLSGCRLVTDKALREGFEGPTLLRRVELDWGTGISDSGIAALAALAPRLEVVNLGRSTASNEALCALARNCPRLRVLDLSFCDQIDDTGIAALRSLTLERLILYCCRNVGDVGLQNLVAAGNMGQLQMLNLHGCRPIQDASLAAIAARAPRLRRLYLNWQASISDEGVQKLARGCPDLETLSLCGLYEVTDASLFALANDCRRLAQLNVYDCSRITDEGIARLAAACPELRDIRLNWCHQVGDASVSALLTHCPRLAHVDVQETGVSTEGLERLLQARISAVGHTRRRPPPS